MSFLAGVYNGPDRTGLAVDTLEAPNLVACCCVNGRGLSMFDLRTPLPLDFIYDVSSNVGSNINIMTILVFSMCLKI